LSLSILSLDLFFLTGASSVSPLLLLFLAIFDVDVSIGSFCRPLARECGEKLSLAASSDVLDAQLFDGDDEFGIRRRFIVDEFMPKDSFLICSGWPSPPLFTGRKLLIEGSILKPERPVLLIDKVF